MRSQVHSAFRAPHSALGSFLRGGLQMLVAGGAVLLEALFELAELLLDFLDRAVERGQHRVRLDRGHKIVVMLGIDAQLELGRVAMLQIDRDLDGGDSVQKPADPLDLLVNFLLRTGTQMTVPGRNVDLHGVKLLLAKLRRGRQGRPWGKPSILAASGKSDKGGANQEVCGFEFRFMSNLPGQHNRNCLSWLALRDQQSSFAQKPRNLWQSYAALPPSAAWIIKNSPTLSLHISPTSRPRSVTGIDWHSHSRIRPKTPSSISPGAALGNSRCITSCTKPPRPC